MYTSATRCGSEVDVQSIYSQCKEKYFCVEITLCISGFWHIHASSHLEHALHPQSPISCKGVQGIKCMYVYIYIYTPLT